MKKTLNTKYFIPRSNYSLIIYFLLLFNWGCTNKVQFQMQKQNQTITDVKLFKTEHVNNNISLVFCHLCKKDNPKYRCTKCKITYYCSKECQKNNWKIHKKVCKSSINNINTNKKDSVEYDQKEENLSKFISPSMDLNINTVRSIVKGEATSETLKFFKNYRDNYFNARKILKPNLYTKKYKEIINNLQYNKISKINTIKDLPSNKMSELQTIYGLSKKTMMDMMKDPESGIFQKVNTYPFLNKIFLLHYFDQNIKSIKYLYNSIKNVSDGTLSLFEQNKLKEYKKILKEKVSKFEIDFKKLPFFQSLKIKILFNSLFISMISKFPSVRKHINDRTLWNDICRNDILISTNDLKHLLDFKGVNYSTKLNNIRGIINIMKRSKCSLREKENFNTIDILIEIIQNIYKIEKRIERVKLKKCTKCNPSYFCSYECKQDSVKSFKEYSEQLYIFKDPLKSKFDALNFDIGYIDNLYENLSLFINNNYNIKNLHNLKNTFEFFKNYRNINPRLYYFEVLESKYRKLSETLFQKQKQDKLSKILKISKSSDLDLLSSEELELYSVYNHLLLTDFLNKNFTIKNFLKNIVDIPDRGLGKVSKSKLAQYKELQKTLLTCNIDLENLDNIKNLEIKVSLCNIILSSIWDIAKKDYPSKENYQINLNKAVNFLIRLQTIYLEVPTLQGIYSPRIYPFLENHYDHKLTALYLLKESVCNLKDNLFSDTNLEYNTLLDTNLKYSLLLDIFEDTIQIEKKIPIRKSKIKLYTVNKIKFNCPWCTELCYCSTDCREFYEAELVKKQNKMRINDKNRTDEKEDIDQDNIPSTKYDVSNQNPVKKQNKMHIDNKNTTEEKEDIDLNKIPSIKCDVCNQNPVFNKCEYLETKVCLRCRYTSYGTKTTTLCKFCFFTHSGKEFCYLCGSLNVTNPNIITANKDRIKKILLKFNLKKIDKIGCFFCSRLYKTNLEKCPDCSNPKNESFAIKYFMDEISSTIKNIDILCSKQNDIPQTTSKDIEEVHLLLSHYLVSFYKIFPLKFYDFYNNLKDGDKLSICVAFLKLKKKNPLFSDDYKKIKSKLKL